VLSVERLRKSYGPGKKSGRPRADETPSNVFAVSDVSFEVAAGELFTLLGPSGCGKTTTLRSIAGLERPDSGSVFLQGKPLFSKDVNVPVNQRGLGMVFQSYAIWPHMTVFDNVAFPLQIMTRARRPAKAEIDRRVKRMLEVTQLDSYADRPATMLSGGQQQRLALARAMLTEPPLMLLDEPLSNLDAKLRESMRFELKRLQRDLGLTSIYVTHDQTEALMLSSRIAVMNKGKIEQIGKPRDIYLRPATRFVAEFIGTSNMLDGMVRERSGERFKVETTEGELWSRCPEQLPPEGTSILTSIRPEGIRLSVTDPGDTMNQWRGSVVTRAFLGDCSEHIVAVGERELRVRSDAGTSLAPGTEVFLSIAPEHVTVIPAG
jgi:iron(III) transport system ATP-binding protein